MRASEKTLHFKNQIHALDWLGSYTRTGRALILALPYRWQHGLVGSHVHDPIDETKLFSWMHREPVETAIVTDKNRQRLVAVDQQDSMYDLKELNRSGA